MAFGDQNGSALVLASRLIYDPTAEPVFRPATPSSAFFNSLTGATVITKKLVYDPTTGPVLLPAGPAAFTFVNPGLDGVRSRKRPSPILASSFVFAIPVDDFGWQAHDQPTLNKKRKILTDNPVSLPVPVGAPIISSTLTGASSGPTVILSRVVYDPTAAPILYSVAAVTTPSAFGYSPDEGRKKRVPRQVLQGIEGSVRPPPSAVVAIAFGYQPADSPRGKPVRRVPEAFATFVNLPAVIPTPPVMPPQGHFLKNEIRRITSLQRG